MPGKVTAVQARIKEMYSKATFVHCAAHRLNLEVNDLNSVAEIRNTVGAIKSIIKFFRERPKRRGFAPNAPLLCETRWTTKYKRTRAFTDHFEDIYKQLGVLTSAMHFGNVDILVSTVYHGKVFSNTGTGNVCFASCRIWHLQGSGPHPEAVVHIWNHRKEANVRFKEDIMTDVEKIAKVVGIEVQMPR